MVSESALIIKSTREVIMGCGNVKQEGDKGVSLPTKEGVGGRLTGRKGLCGGGVRGAKNEERYTKRHCIKETDSS